MGMAHLRHRESRRGPRRARRVARAAMIERLLNKLLSADVIGLALLLTALQTLTYGIASSLRNTDTKYFFWVCCVAALIAIGLGKLKWSGIQTSILMIGVGQIGR